jgi:hypothetical protein
MMSWLSTSEDIGKYRHLSILKLTVHLVFFIVLWGIYAKYFKAFLDLLYVNSGTAGISLGFWSIFRFVLIHGLPFGVVSFLYRDWNGSDAAGASLAAFIAAEILWCNRLGLSYCASGLLIMPPLLASAAIGHVIGGLLHQRLSKD